MGGTYNTLSVDNIINRAAAMNRVVLKGWRDAASLIVVSKRVADGSSTSRSGVDYDILFQTRSCGASFANSVVFPGGVCEPSDGAARWLDLLRSFGYAQQDFAALHRPDSSIPPTPLFGSNPVLRHIQLRITAIRETFEELGLLICSQKKKEDRSGVWADTVTDIDVKHWQKRVSRNPEELYELCREHSCYPDVWSLHYWSNWLTPLKYPKRFDTAFFVTALQHQTTDIGINSEVTKVEWLYPLEVLDNPNKQVFPPQVYELKRLMQITDLEKLIHYAKERSRYDTELLFGLDVNTKDGVVQLMPGDDLFPLNIHYDDNPIEYIDKTIADLREDSKVLHRLEICRQRKEATFIIRNYRPKNHIDMGDKIIPVEYSILP